MLYVVSYDITNDRMRNRACRLLKDHGKRVQYSVFECETDPAEMAALLKTAGSLLTGPKDNLRVYGLCRTCCNTSRRLEPVQGQNCSKTSGRAPHTSRGIEKLPAFIVV